MLQNKQKNTHTFICVLWNDLSNVDVVGDSFLLFLLRSITNKLNSDVFIRIKRGDREKKAHTRDEIMLHFDVCKYIYFKHFKYCAVKMMTNCIECALSPWTSISIWRIQMRKKKVCAHSAKSVRIRMLCKNNQQGISTTHAVVYVFCVCFSFLDIDNRE